jgi:uncharacterized cofD-like protein
MEQLMQYRFKEGDLKGQNFGNLFIAAMNDISSSFEEAIKKMSDVLAVKGKVYPVTLENVTLFAALKDGTVVEGESSIPEESKRLNSPVERIYLEPNNPKPFENALYAIDDADCIIIGPGSLYTSVLPNLVIDEVTERIKNSKAIKIYVSNIMTQPGETDKYNLSDHIKAIEKHCGHGIVDFVIANNGKIPEENFVKYFEDKQDIVNVDVNNLPKNIEVITEDLVYIKGELLRHNSTRLGLVIMKLILKKAIPKNRRRILDYYYLSERIKEKQKEVK